MKIPPTGEEAALCSDAATAGLTGWEAGCIFNGMCSSDASGVYFHRPEPEFLDLALESLQQGVLERQAPSHISSLMAVAGIFYESVALAFVLCFPCNGKS